eukprot:CAMPEP_0114458108 /NCGR_PEP_ID=MMETSP0104-20121206/4514_1 /TAXON_ID=37642 ORGANISM="Paraphysomonas imperforata, Strain PA2" /NCGR_SAMPLE_ID=MMETSP0104 /ASSEMBLY_ACC=CAM_ASM_000202 /LENGTH=200 /DNA_ID=CAMNT_0001630687 /DNA_START=40 /DNA_END=642 /DNA_ORIENTATION=-
MKVSALSVVLYLASALFADAQIVECLSTKGVFEIEIFPDWSPLGAQRYLELVQDGFYTDIPMYRSVAGFLTQFGITENPAHKHWHGNQIKDDPNLHKGIRKHYVSFAGGGPNTRSTQIFIAYKDLDFLGKAPWETPFGRVVAGGDVVDSLHTGYGDIPPYGKGPDQQQLYRQGNSYIREQFPLTDFIQRCRVKGKDEEEF